MPTNRSWQIKGHRLRKYTDRLAKQNTKEISKVFNLLLKDIKKDNPGTFAEQKSFKVNYKAFERAMLEALRLIFRRNIERSTDFTNTLFGWKLEKPVIQAVRNKVIEQYNKKVAGKMVKNISKTTRDTINRIVLNGQREGLNKRDIAKQLEISIKGMSKKRAKMIATTETSNAVNNATNATAKGAGMREKGWIYTDIAKTPRENHKILDNTWIPFDKKFNLGGGIFADYPHDPALPASERINCHCIAVYR